MSSGLLLLFLFILASKCFIASALVGEDKTKGAHAAGVESTKHHICEEKSCIQTFKLT